MNQQEQEAYVRARWKRAELYEGLIGEDEYEYGWRVLIVGVGRMKACDTEAAAWQAAYEWTAAREEEIRQLRAEIEALQINSYAGSDKFEDSIGEGLNVARRTIHHCRLSRTLDRLQEALAELKKGMVQP